MGKRAAPFPGLLLVALLACAAVAASSASASDCQDADGDGYGVGCLAGPDCNDEDSSVHPGAPEACNLRDDDCNGVVDDSPLCESLRIDASPVAVPAGPFVMGSERGAADERPVHRVELSAFTLDRNEVTNRRYRRCVEAGACARPALTSSHLRPRYYGNVAFDDYPVILVSWEQAERFCRFAGGRLPTEAEWEKSARGPAPDMREYPWGADRSPHPHGHGMGGVVDDPRG